MILFSLFIFCLVHGASDKDILKVVHVYSLGTDEPLCGSAFGRSACKTVVYAYNQAGNCSDWFQLMIWAGNYAENTGIIISAGSQTEITGQFRDTSLCTVSDKDFILFTLSGDNTIFVLSNLTILLSHHDGADSFVCSADVKAKVMITFKACRISVNTLYTGSCICNSCVFINNKFASCVFVSCTIYNITSSPSPFIYAPGQIAELWIRNTSFVHVTNSHTGNAGESGCFYVANITKFFLIDSLFVKCNSNSSGVGWVNCLLESGTVLNCVFWNCSLMTGGKGASALRISSDELTDTAITFTNASLVFCSLEGAGGALFLRNNIITFWFCSFVSCAAGVNCGGALHGECCALCLVQCTFVKCRPEAVSAYLNTTVDVVSCVFSKSEEFDMYIMSSTLTLATMYTTTIVAGGDSFYSCYCDNYSVCFGPVTVLLDNNTCSTEFFNDSPIDGTCPIPCFATAPATAPAHTQTCVLPHQCPPNTIPSGGRCMPACVFWALYADGNGGGGDGGNNSSDSSDHNEDGKSDSDRNSSGSNSDGLCSPHCVSVPSDVLGYGLCARGQEQQGEGEGEGQETEDQGSGNNNTGNPQQQLCFSEGWLCAEPEECSSRVPDTTVMMMDSALFPCGGGECYLDPARENYYNPPYLRSSGSSSGGDNVYIDVRDSWDNYSNHNSGMCATECLVPEHYVADPRTGYCVARPCSERVAIMSQQVEVEVEGGGEVKMDVDEEGERVRVRPCGPGKCYLNSGWDTVSPPGTMCAEVCSNSDHFEVEVIEEEIGGNGMDSDGGWGGGGGETVLSEEDTGWCVLKKCLLRRPHRNVSNNNAGDGGGGGKEILTSFSLSSSFSSLPPSFSSSSSSSLCGSDDCYLDMRDGNGSRCTPCYTDAVTCDGDESEDQKEGEKEEEEEEEEGREDEDSDGEGEGESRRRRMLGVWVGVDSVSRANDTDTGNINNKNRKVNGEEDGVNGRKETNAGNGSGSRRGGGGSCVRDDLRRACVWNSCLFRTADVSRGVWPCGYPSEHPPCLQDVGGLDETRCVLACTNPFYFFAASAAAAATVLTKAATAKTSSAVAAAATSNINANEETQIGKCHLLDCSARVTTVQKASSVDWPCRAFAGESDCFLDTAIAPADTTATATCTRNCSHNSHALYRNTDEEALRTGKCTRIPCYMFENSPEVCKGLKDCRYVATATDGEGEEEKGGKRGQCIENDGNDDDGSGSGSIDITQSRRRVFVIGVSTAAGAAFIGVVFVPLVVVVVWKRRKNMEEKKKKKPLMWRIVENKNNSSNSTSSLWTTKEKTTSSSVSGSGEIKNSECSPLNDNQNYMTVMLLANDEVIACPPSQLSPNPPSSQQRFFHFSQSSHSSPSLPLTASSSSSTSPPYPYFSSSSSSSVSSSSSSSSSSSFSSSSSSFSSSSSSSSSLPSPLPPRIPQPPRRPSIASSMRKHTNANADAKIVGNYTLLETLGTGSFGKVFRCARRSGGLGSGRGREYAIKRISSTSVPDSGMERNIANSLGTKLKSKFLVKYYETISDTTSGDLYIVMELCAKGSLRTLIDSFLRLEKHDAILSPFRIAKILIQLVLGLEVLHRNEILHRDLKPENVFLDSEDNVKIGDFGCALKLDFSAQKRHTIIGTPLYESPEVIEGKEYDSSADMWSLGVLLYELCTLALPFDESSLLRFQRAVQRGKYKPIPAWRCPAEISEIVYSLLNLNPQKRPTASEILKLPFVKDSAEKFKLTRYFP